MKKKYIDANLLLKSSFKIIGHFDLPNGKAQNFEAISVADIINTPAANVVARSEYDALLKRFKHLIQNDVIRSFDEINPHTRKYVKDVVTADIAEVVRCKDCKYERLCCTCIRTSGRLPDDYCNFGERKDGDHDDV